MSKYFSKDFWKSNDKKLSNDDCVEQRVDAKHNSCEKSSKRSKTKKSNKTSSGTTTKSINEKKSFESSNEMTTTEKDKEKSVKSIVWSSSKAVVKSLCCGLAIDSDDEPYYESIPNKYQPKEQIVTKPKASDSIEFDYKSLNTGMSVRQIRDLIESIHRLPKPEMNKPVITDPKRADDMPVLKELELKIPKKSGQLLPKQVSEPEMEQSVDKIVITQQISTKSVFTTKSMNDKKGVSSGLSLQTQWSDYLTPKYWKTKFESQKSINKRIRLEKVIFLQRKIRANNEMKIERNRYQILRRNVIKLQHKFRAKKAMEIERNNYCLIREKVIFVQRKFREKRFHKLSESDIKLLQICNQNHLIEQKLVFCDQNCKLLAKGSFGSVYSMTENVNNKDINVVFKKTQMSICSNYEKTKYLPEYKYLFSDIFIGLRLSDLKAIPENCYYCENFSNILSNDFVYENKDLSEGKRKQFRHFITKMSFAGTPIYLLNPISPKRGISLARQLMASLAVAESVLEFEHRDLHLKNVLVLQTKQKRVNFKINDKQIEIKSNGFKLNIIDTTYSRMKFGNKIYFNDLTNAMASLAKQDSSKLSPHYWVYKKQCELTQNDWSRFCPKSNIYWTHFHLKHILTLIDKSTVDQSVHSKRYFQLLEKWTNTITQYNSVFEFLYPKTNVSQTII